MNCITLPIFGDGVFDFVYSSHLLEHIVDTEGALREWLRVLSEDGYLILYLPHKLFYPNIGQPGANPDHKHDFLPQDIINIMRRLSAKVGLELIENEERNGGDEYSFLQVYRKTAAPGFRDCTQPKAAKRAAIVRPACTGIRCGARASRGSSSSRVST
jgi:predicted SAM-dependent methyltransferase